jgi:hypothetical protein
MSVAALGPERNAMVVVVFGDDDIRDFRAKLLETFSHSPAESIRPNPVEQPVGIPVNRKAQKKDPESNG